jgi:hypothetical protein
VGKEAILLLVAVSTSYSTELATDLAAARRQARRSRGVRDAFSRGKCPLGAKTLLYL